MEHVGLPEHLEHAVATEYFGDYVQNGNENQAAQIAWLLRGCVAAKKLPVPAGQGGSEAKREYVRSGKEYQDAQTQKSPHEAGAKKPQSRGLVFSYRVGLFGDFVSLGLKHRLNNGGQVALIIFERRLNVRHCGLE